MSFIVKARSTGRSSICITLPNETVELYKIFKDDLLEVDIIKNHREGKKE